MLSDDALDAKLGEALAMALVLPIVLASAHLEDRHLLAATVGEAPRARLEAAIRGHLAALHGHGDYTTASIKVFNFGAAPAPESVRAVRRAYEEVWSRLIAELQQAGALPEQAVSLLRMMRINGQRLLELINRLLDFSKLEAGRMTLSRGPVELNALVEKLAGAARPLCEQRGVQLVLDCDPHVASVDADEEKLDTVVANLISNAIKFTPQGGSVRVETYLADDRAWLAVTDTGIGIDRAHHARIFERFVQVDGSSSR